MDIKVLSAVLRTYVHATEDLEKVKKALINILPVGVRGNVNIDIVKTKGHYGNEISILSIKLKGRSSDELLRNILCRLSESERGILIASLSDRVDPRVSHLYIRLSKQDAYLGRIRLLDGSDVIKIVFSFTSLKSVDSLRNVLEEMIKSC
ncbi:MAG: exosome protein [Thermoprotei archaeon]|nr:MAG: exosome protein [Thermoprotei archaeon]